MFIAMNHFQVKSGKNESFEEMWLSRETFLSEVPGFIEFALLRGVDGAYISHSVWQSREDFDQWTKSENFSRGHRGGGSVGDILDGHPQVDLWDAVIVERPDLG